MGLERPGLAKGGRGACVDVEVEKEENEEDE